MNRMVDTIGMGKPSDLLKVSLSFAAFILAFYIVEVLYSVYFGPLSKFPGPKLWSFSKLPYIRTMVTGDEARGLSRLHQQYGPIVRTGPRQLSFAGRAHAWKSIYGFRKHGQTAPQKDSRFYNRPQFATYRMPEHFKDADEFHPERLLCDEKCNNDDLDAVEPFSVGPRNCLGRNLAWHEMRLLMVAVLLHFDLKLCEESENWADQKVYTLWEKVPLLCSLTPRPET